MSKQNQHGPVREALEESLAALKAKGRLYPEITATVEATRTAATRVDNAPPTDNVALSVYLKFLEKLHIDDLTKSKPKAPTLSQLDDLY